MYLDTHSVFHSKFQALKEKNKQETVILQYATEVSIFYCDIYLVKSVHPYIMAMIIFQNLILRESVFEFQCRTCLLSYFHSQI
jgi:hypothetical protein